MVNGSVIRCQRHNGHLTVKCQAKPSYQGVC
jgi:hypothetical protein